MYPDLAMRMLGDLFWTGLLVGGPVLGITMLVGIVVSIFQVVTQIQEMSLTFLPKLCAAGAALVVGGPWMLKKLSHFTVRLWADIPSLF